MCGQHSKAHSSHLGTPKKSKENFAQCQDGSEMIPGMYRVSLEAQQSRELMHTGELKEVQEPLLPFSSLHIPWGWAEHTLTVGSVRASLTLFSSFFWN